MGMKVIAPKQTISLGIDLNILKVKITNLLLKL
jgi:hypothetical protein